MFCLMEGNWESLSNPQQTIWNNFLRWQNKHTEDVTLFSKRWGLSCFLTAIEPPPYPTPPKKKYQAVDTCKKKIDIFWEVGWSMLGWVIKLWFWNQGQFSLIIKFVWVRKAEITTEKEYKGFGGLIVLIFFFFFFITVLF